MRRNPQQRIIAGVLALLAQAGLIAWVSQSRVRQVEHAADSTYLIFIQPLKKPDIAPARPRTRISNPTTIAVFIPGSDPRDPIEPAEIHRAIKVSPESDSPIDWYKGMEEGVRRAVDIEEERKRRDTALNSKPDILVIPERPHRAGDTERYDDGAVLTWLNERCYVIFEPRAPAARVCKTPTLAERRREARRAELEQAMKPEYLSRPLPLPRAPQKRYSLPATSLSDR